MNIGQVIFKVLDNSDENDDEIATIAIDMFSLLSHPNEWQTKTNVVTV